MLKGRDIIQTETSLARMAKREKASVNVPSLQLWLCLQLQVVRTISDWPRLKKNKTKKKKKHAAGSAVDWLDQWDLHAQQGQAPGALTLSDKAALNASA